MPREIKFLVNSAMSVYSAVSGASALPERRGKSIMTSILPELVTDAESDFSVLSQKTPGLFEDNADDCKLPPQLPSPLQLPFQSPPHSPCRSCKKSSFLTRTKYFDELVERLFIEIDTNNADFIDRKELYSGLLLIHLNLSNYAGIFASKPPDCAEAYSTFDDIDVESNGLLDKSQYKEAAGILSSQIVQRVAIHCSVVTLIFIFGILQYLSLNVMHVIDSIYSFQFIRYTIEGLIIICKDILPYCAVKIYENLYEALTGLYTYFDSISPIKDIRCIFMLLIPGALGYILVNKHMTVCRKKISPSIIFQ